MHNENKEIQHVFIIGSKGIPAKYGGFESFLENLTLYQKNSAINYHIACMPNKADYARDNHRFMHNGADCFQIRAFDIGASRAVLYDLSALEYCIQYVKKNQIKQPIIYILACRIGPFIGRYKKRINKLGGCLMVNPDGHEWLRGKWSGFIKKYWKISERLMVKNADLIICDSRNIEKYIHKEYKKYCPETKFIAYGSGILKSQVKDHDQKIESWYYKNQVKPGEYYLIVGRFVPENNYKIMIREFMASSTKKPLVIITKYKGEKLYERMQAETLFETDPRIKFAGTVYDTELLKKIRENAFGYLHGHEVGGTNPSLLEAMGSTKINLLLDVGFNKEVGGGCALYWNKTEGNLKELIHKTDGIPKLQQNEMGEAARKRMNDLYSWEFIVNEYESTFLGAGAKDTLLH